MNEYNTIMNENNVSPIILKQLKVYDIITMGILRDTKNNDVIDKYQINNDT